MTARARLVQLRRRARAFEAPDAGPPCRECGGGMPGPPRIGDVRVQLDDEPLPEPEPCPACGRRPRTIVIDLADGG